MFRGSRIPFTASQRLRVLSLPVNCREISSTLIAAEDRIGCNRTARPSRPGVAVPPASSSLLTATRFAGCDQRLGKCENRVAR